ncbi:spermidine synthase [Streptomyces qinzhouensis]|uniref:Spermidine synthase n=2 Tax=Streptomyces qinzhouensis TaxID=2599401 RepID=A0A5B8IRC3_9ACTN|nr:spermidine synthase [Streptomyces qinzhouensis]
MSAPVTLDRREGPYGEVVLRRRGDHHEIIANGCFLMDTSDGRSERRLVDAAFETLTAATGPRSARTSEKRPIRPALLIGGLGVGFSLAHAAADSRWGAITVVEREAAIVDWHLTGPLSGISGPAVDDPRSVILRTDLLAHLRAVKHRYDALCLDIDNGPDWTVTEDNAGLYTLAGLALCRTALTSGGVLAIWSAQPSPEFEQALRNAGFSGVRTEEILVARGVPDVVHLAVSPA